MRGKDNFTQDYNCRTGEGVGGKEINWRERKKERKKERKERTKSFGG